MNYLCYVSHDAENLQFYLWLADYHHRFQRAPQSEKQLCPKWQADELLKSDNKTRPFSPSMSEKHMVILGVKEQDISTLSTEDMSNASTWEDQQTRYSATISSMDLDGFPSADVIGAAGIKWQTFASQPFRAEVNRIAFHYIAPGSPRELNLSDHDRAAVLYALQQTTHPSAFTLVKRMLDSVLRNQAHPNFIRWSICNGSRARTIFLCSFAIMNITIGFVIAIVLTLSSYSRYWRIFAALEWWFGITNLIAAYRGLCVLLHRLHTRNVRPWETVGVDAHSSYPLGDGEAEFEDFNIRYDDTVSRWPVKMEVFGAANNYNGESWLAQEEKKSVWQKIFDRKMTVQPGGLSIIQNKIIRQAEAWALLITVPLTAGFVAMPKGNFF
ncbi:MAG: hypothetical protein Q9191_002042 [Dirinaria sp. TL-2023a]